MQVDIEQLRALMVEVCRHAKMPEEVTGIVVEHYLEGELRGKPTHGIAKFCFESRFFSQREGSPQVTRDYNALAIVDARREVGPVSALYAVDVAIHKAREFGAGIVGMINTQRYGVLAPWAERMAVQGLIGLVMNTSRAEGVVDGSTTPFLGVNPLSFAFPASGAPFVVDMSTTKAPMGQLWEARRSGMKLPENCFVDSFGEFTRDPRTARSAVVFGGHKGFAVSLLVQVLTGSLFGFPMSQEVQSTWQTGYTFIAIDPSFGGALTEFTSKNSELVDVMEAAVTREGTPLRLPGKQAATRMAMALQAGSVQLEDLVYERLRAQAEGDLERD